MSILSKLEYNSPKYTSNINSYTHVFYLLGTPKNGVYPTYTPLNTIVHPMTASATPNNAQNNSSTLNS